MKNFNAQVVTELYFAAVRDNVNNAANIDAAFAAIFRELYARCNFREQTVIERDPIPDIGPSPDMIGLAGMALTFGIWLGQRGVALTDDEYTDDPEH